MNVAAILKLKGNDVTTAKSSATLLDISQKLGKHKIGAIVIIDEQHKICGIISERDVIRAVSEHGAEALKMPVNMVMTKDVVTCTEMSVLDELMELMTQGRFRHVPVVAEDKKLVGIVSIGDVVKNHIAEVEMEVTAMRGYLATG